MKRKRKFKQPKKEEIQFQDTEIYEIFFIHFFMQEIYLFEEKNSYIIEDYSR